MAKFLKSFSLLSGLISGLCFWAVAGVSAFTCIITLTAAVTTLGLHIAGFDLLSTSIKFFGLAVASAPIALTSAFFFKLIDDFWSTAQTHNGKSSL